MRGAINHFLKIHPQYFEAVKSGRKSFEIRRSDDRDFQEGDTLTLQEFDPQAVKPYTGAEILVVVSYILSDGVVWQGKPASIMGIQHDLFASGL